MDLINWSLNAMDTLFSTRSHGSGEPLCPHGTLPAGYTMDGWKNWQILCLAGLSIEDVYLFGTFITGLYLIGVGMALGYRKLKKAVSAVQVPSSLATGVDVVGRAVSTQSAVLDCKMDYTREKLTSLTEAQSALIECTTGTINERLLGIAGTQLARLERSMDTILEKLTAIQREIERPANQ